MKFDDFLSTINDWGRFQKVKYTLICLTYMLPPIMVYTYSFTAAVPDFRCAIQGTDHIDQYNEEANALFNSQYKPTEAQCKETSKILSVVECQRCYIQPSPNNRSSQSTKLKECNKYVYSREHYELTLIEEWTMVCDRVWYRATAQMVFFIGYMVGSVFFGVLADKYGRHPVMSISFILLSISGFLSAFGPQRAFGVTISYVIFVTARFLIACATRGISVSGFVLGSEIVGPNKRLLAGIVIEYFFAFGQYFLVAFAYFLRSWRSLTGLISSFTVPFILFYFILPESPRWLISKGRFNEAEKVLRRIAAVNKREFNQDAFEQVKETQKNSMMDKHNQEGLLGLFRSKIMLIVSFNLFFQWLVQNLVFYGVSQNTGSWNINPYLAFFLSGIVELIAYIIVHLILDRIGRKLPYCSFAVLFGIISFLILPVQQFTEGNVRRALLILINILLKFCASASYAIIYIYANELFPTNVRNTGMGICSMVARIGAIIGTFCNDSLTRVWTHLPVLLYGGFSLLAALLALMFPETLNKPLPQTVAEAERMVLDRTPNGKAHSSTTNGTEFEGQLLTTVNEDNTIKQQLKASDISDNEL